jgi:single-stranded DNA-binding protein
MNIAIIKGTLGQDPEIKQTTSGNNVATTSVATNKTYLDKD